VNEVIPDSPAAKSGIQPNDVIIKADGKSIQNPQDLVKIVRNYQSGQTLQLIVIRNKIQMEIPVILGNVPEKTYNATIPSNTMDNNLETPGISQLQ
jgi:S1-C subfamily serine protease